MLAALSARIIDSLCLLFGICFYPCRECSPGLSGIVSIRRQRPRASSRRHRHGEINEFLRHHKISAAGFCRIRRNLARGCAGTGLAAFSEFSNPRRSRNASEAIEPQAPKGPLTHGALARLWAGRGRESERVAGNGCTHPVCHPCHCSRPPLPSKGAAPGFTQE